MPIKRRRILKDLSEFAPYDFERFLVSDTGPLWEPWRPDGLLNILYRSGLRPLDTLKQMKDGKEIKTPYGLFRLANDTNT